MHFLARKQCSIKYETNEIQYAIFCVKNLHKIHYNLVSLHLAAVSKSCKYQKISKYIESEKKNVFEYYSKHRQHTVK